MQLSTNFSLIHLTKSNTAARLGINNIPTDPKIIDNLKFICNGILEPLKAKYGNSLIINSGFRSLALNKAIGSKDTSQHVVGEAIDIEVLGISNYELALWISKNLEFDQLILEMYNKNDGPNSGWVHCSLRKVGNRKQLLTIYSKLDGRPTANGLIP